MSKTTIVEDGIAQRGVTLARADTRRVAANGIGAILIGEDSYLKSQNLLKDLRDSGLNVAVDSTNRKMDKQLKSAAKAGYKYVLFIGEQELESGEYKLKNLESGQEQTLAAHEIHDFVKD